MLTLVLGGARSGKSLYARELCSSVGDVVFVATARSNDDPEMVVRIARHRAERPGDWKTVEEPIEVARAVRETDPGSHVLVDCVTLWLSNLLFERRSLPEPERERIVREAVTDFARAARERNVVAISNEVGSGVVPDQPVGRSFRDLQGQANQILAAEAERVVLMVAGLPLVLKDAKRAVADP